MAQRSRLSRRLENQTKKTFFLSIAGILVVLFLLIKFGIPLLANFSIFISGINSKDETINKKDSLTFVPPPILQDVPTATFSAQISISGTGVKDNKIKLYVNDRLVDDTTLVSDTNFTFKDVLLTKGENIIHAKSITKDNKQSDFSNTLVISYKDSTPTLTIDSPKDNQAFSKDENSANVSGKTDPKVRVYVNGFWAIVDDSGKFSYILPLKSGENKISISAVDEAGNKTEKELKVTYSP